VGESTPFKLRSSSPGRELGKIPRLTSEFRLQVEDSKSGRANGPPALFFDCELKRGRDSASDLSPRNLVREVAGLSAGL
jgi:hypothetical protein